MKTIIASIAVIIALINVGCVSQVVNASLVSTKKIDFANKTYRVDTAKQLSEEFTVGTLFLNDEALPWIQQATEDALTKNPNCIAIANATIVREWTSYVLFGVANYKVKGNPVYEVSTSAK